MQVRDGFDLVIDQELRYGDVSVQLENVLPQEVGRPLDALGVVLDRAQQNAILEVQGPEAGELFRRLPGHFVSAPLDQDALDGPRLRKGQGAAGVLVDALPDAFQAVVLAQGLETVILPRVGRRELRALQRRSTGAVSGDGVAHLPHGLEELLLRQRGGNGHPNRDTSMSCPK